MAVFSGKHAWKFCKRVYKLNPYVFIEEPKLELPHFLNKCKIGTTRRNKYGELKQRSHGTIKCRCERPKYDDDDDLCFEHSHFDTGFYNGKIEKRSYFQELVKELDTVEKLHLFLRGSLRFSFYLRNRYFHRNAKILIKACIEEHDEITKISTLKLRRMIYQGTVNQIAKSKRRKEDCI